MNSASRGRGLAGKPVTESNLSRCAPAQIPADMDGSSYRLAGIECAAERLFCVAPLASLGGGWSRVRVDRVGVGCWAGRMVGPVAFVGREAELSRLVGALGGVC